MRLLRTHTLDIRLGVAKNIVGTHLFPMFDFCLVYVTESTFKFYRFRFEIFNPRPVISAIKHTCHVQNKSCDIIFSTGQIHFAGFSLFVFMVYVMNKSWLQVVILVRNLWF
jgi:hypothetical protein